MSGATHCAFLRAVNVGGTGKLAMADLKALAGDLGFQNPRTHIASGNLVFESPLAQAELQPRLHTGLARLMGQPVGVLMRSAAELHALLARNPFPDAAGNRLLVTLLPDAPTQPLAAQGQRDEVWQLLGRELWVHYPSGQGQSKLRIPGAAAGTARNLNTLQAVLKLADPQPSP